MSGLFRGYDRAGLDARQVGARLTDALSEVSLLQTRCPTRGGDFFAQ